MSSLPLFDPSLACRPLSDAEQAARQSRHLAESQQPHSLFTGPTKRDLGHQSVTEAAPATSEWLHEALGVLCQMYPELTSDDLQSALWGAPPAVREDIKRHPAIMGAVMRSAAVSGKLRDSGQTRQTKRDDGRARRLVLWTVVKCHG